MDQLSKPKGFGAIAPADCAKHFAVRDARTVENVVANARPIAAVVGDVKITIGIFTEHGSAQSRGQR